MRGYLDRARCTHLDTYLLSHRQGWLNPVCKLHVYQWRSLHRGSMFIFPHLVLPNGWPLSPEHCILEGKGEGHILHSKIAGISQHFFRWTEQEGGAEKVERLTREPFTLAKTWGEKKKSHLQDEITVGNSSLYSSIKPSVWSTVHVWTLHPTYELRCLWVLVKTDICTSLRDGPHSWSETR